MEGPTKNCPFCAEEMRTEGKACPHCGQWVSRIQRTAHSNVLIIIGAVLVSMVVPLWMFWWLPRQMFYEGRKYVDHPNSVAVEADRMVFSEDGQVVCVIGWIRNAGAIPWQWVSVKVDFYDAKDELIDTADDTLPGVLMPGERTSFRVESGHPKRLTDYARHKAYVAAARDAKSLP